MKKKINRYFIAIAVFSILMSTLAMTLVTYTQLKRQVFSDLKIIVELLSDSASYDELPEDTRVTIINSDGTVCFDSVVDAAGLENHMDRPEVAEAFRNGFGQEARISDTLSESVFYYAKCLDNGQVLRVGKQAASVYSLFLKVIPVIVVMILILIAVCMMASHYLTGVIISPIDSLVEDMDHINEGAIYEELIPFTRKIRSQHEEILSAANMRQEFTANVSHELKTPLTAISGYAELMETGLVNSSDVKHFSQEIRKSAGRLLALINDIIKLSQLDSGENEDLLEIVDIAVITRDTVDMLAVNAAKADVSITYEGCDSAGIRIGREMAEELTYNLIENAIRYNKAGGSVKTSVISEADEIVFTVADTGIGIPKEHQERIFERFYRVDKSRSKELGGTGLGLAIVKHICNLTGGRITLDSGENKGTTVRIAWDKTIKS